MSEFNNRISVRVIEHSVFINCTFKDIDKNQSTGCIESNVYTLDRYQEQLLTVLSEPAQRRAS